MKERFDLTKPSARIEGRFMRNKITEGGIVISPKKIDSCLSSVNPEEMEVSKIKFEDVLRILLEERSKKEFEFRSRKAKSCLPKGSVIVEIKDGENRKGSRNETQSFVVVYSLEGKLFRTSLSGQPSGSERRRTK
jgi:hypothetical protein